MVEARITEFPEIRDRIIDVLYLDQETDDNFFDSINSEKCTEETSELFDTQLQQLVYPDSENDHYREQTNHYSRNSTMSEVPVVTVGSIDNVRISILDSELNDKVEHFVTETEGSGDEEEINSVDTIIRNDPTKEANCQETTRKMATSLTERLQQQCLSELDFKGFYDEAPATGNVTITQDMRDKAREEFRVDYVEAVEFTRAMLLPGGNHSPENELRSKRTAFVTGLGGQAKGFYDSFDAGTRRDYNRLLDRFRARYPEVMDEEEKKARRKEVWEEFKSIIPQRDKSLAQYLAEGVYWYGKLDNRFKSINDFPDELERAFVEGLSDRALVDTVRLNFKFKNSTTFTIAEVKECVKDHHRQQWNNEEFKRVMGQLKGKPVKRESSDLGDLSCFINEGIKSGFTTIVESMGGLRLNASQSGSQSGSATSSSGISSQGRQENTTVTPWVPRNSGIICYNCDETGHISSRCTQPPRPRQTYGRGAPQQVQITQAEVVNEDRQREVDDDGIRIFVDQH